MAKARVFISFDYDNDFGCKTMLAGQSDHSDSPFEFVDASVKDHLTGDWKEKVKGRISRCDQFIVLCGTSTHKATGVAEELKIAQELRKPYFLLAAHSDKTCTKPTTAKSDDKVYNWTWPNLKSLIAGNR